MSSIRNSRSEDRYLDAARDCILATGWTRTTLTDVARRAGVSRMTIYRTWPDMQTLLADLMTREWAGVVAVAAESGADAAGSSVRRRLAAGVARTTAALRSNDLLRKIVDVDPQLLLPYVLQRRGRSQDHILDILQGLVSEGQREGSVREGDPHLLTRSIMLAAQGYTLSAETMTDAELPASAYDQELADLIERYLAP